VHREFEAWDLLIRKYQRLIYSVPVRMRLGEEDCADVFQSVCLTLYRHLTQLRDIPRLSSWLLTAAQRESLHVLERQRLRRRREQSAVQPEVTSEDSGESLLLAVEQQVLIRQAITALPERCRELLSILYYELPGASYAEVETRLKMPHGSIAPTRARCLNQLREKLTRLGFG
jgi:RNA polymerase sigma factor (sigma-70 family)